MVWLSRVPHKHHNRVRLPDFATHVAAGLLVLILQLGIEGVLPLTILKMTASAVLERREDHS